MAAEWDMSTTNLIDENEKFDFKYDISNPASYSVSKAIEGLNSGAIPWEHEYAIVYSNREKKYYLLAKRGRTCSLVALRDYAASH